MRVIQHIGGKLPVYLALVDADLKQKGPDCKKATAAEIAACEETQLRDKYQWDSSLGQID